MCDDDGAAAYLFVSYARGCVVYNKRNYIPTYMREKSHVVVSVWRSFKLAAVLEWTFRLEKLKIFVNTFFVKLVRCMCTVQLQNCPFK